LTRQVVDEGRVVSRSEFSTTYELNGRYASVSSDVPMNTRAAGGGWVEVSTDLSQDANGGWSSDAHPLNPVFAANASDDGAVSFERDGYRVSLTLDGAADVRA